MTTQKIFNMIVKRATAGRYRGNGINNIDWSKLDNEQKNTLKKIISKLSGEWPVTPHKSIPKEVLGLKGTAKKKEEKKPEATNDPKKEKQKKDAEKQSSMNKKKINNNDALATLQNNNAYKSYQKGEGGFHVWDASRGGDTVGGISRRSHKDWEGWKEYDEMKKKLGKDGLNKLSKWSDIPKGMRDKIDKFYVGFFGQKHSAELYASPNRMHAYAQFGPRTYEKIRKEKNFYGAVKRYVSELPSRTDAEKKAYLSRYTKDDTGELDKEPKIYKLDDKGKALVDEGDATETDTTEVKTDIIRDGSSSQGNTDIAIEKDNSEQPKPLYTREEEKAISDETIKDETTIPKDIKQPKTGETIKPEEEKGQSESKTTTETIDPETGSKSTTTTTDSKPVDDKPKTEHEWKMLRLQEQLDLSKKQGEVVKTQTEIALQNGANLAGVSVDEFRKQQIRKEDGNKVSVLSVVTQTVLGGLADMMLEAPSAVAMADIGNTQAIGNALTVKSSVEDSGLSEKMRLEREKSRLRQLEEDNKSANKNAEKEKQVGRDIRTDIGKTKNKGQLEGYKAQLDSRLEVQKNRYDAWKTSYQEDQDNLRSDNKNKVDIAKANLDKQTKVWISAQKIQARAEQGLLNRNSKEYIAFVQKNSNALTQYNNARKMNPILPPKFVSVLNRNGFSLGAGYSNYLQRIASDPAKAFSELNEASAWKGHTRNEMSNDIAQKTSRGIMDANFMAGSELGSTNRQKLMAVRSHINSMHVAKQIIEQKTKKYFDPETYYSFMNAMVYGGGTFTNWTTWGTEVEGDDSISEIAIRFKNGLSKEEKKSGVKVSSLTEKKYTMGGKKVSVSDLYVEYAKNKKGNPDVLMSGASAIDLQYAQMGEAKGVSEAYSKLEGVIRLSQQPIAY